MNNLDSIYRKSSPESPHICEHCLGVIEHETWCITRDPKVQYAHAIVNDPYALSYRDSLILHSLGVAWRAKAR